MLSGLWFYIIVFVDAPHILLPSELSGASSRFDSESQLEAVSEEPPDLNTAPRGWWRYKDIKADGLKTSILVIRGLLMTQKFDVRLILPNYIIDLRASFMRLNVDTSFLNRESLDLGAKFCPSSVNAPVFCFQPRWCFCCRYSCTCKFKVLTLSQHWHSLISWSVPIFTLNF